MKIHEGQSSAAGLRVGIVVSRFNELITGPLREGAQGAFRRNGGSDDSLEIAHVPGAFELPLVAKKMAETGRFDAVVCLGCVIRGATSHYDYVCAQTASGIMNAGLATGVPIIFGVLTTDTIEQAFERAGSKAGNKGTEAMLAAIEMVGVLKSIQI